MEKEKVLLLENVQNYIRTTFLHDTTGHDYYHIERVAKMSERIAASENADVFLCVLAAWLHDLGDYKLNGGVDKSESLIRAYLNGLNLENNIIDQVVKIVSQVSFSKGKMAETLEAKIVQDADRLDAIGAIGIARTFAYGGSAGNPIYNPLDKSENTSIQHFYDKLLKLKDLMHTKIAIKIAEDRQSFMQEFLDQFYYEWETSDSNNKL